MRQQLIISMLTSREHRKFTLGIRPPPTYLDLRPSRAARKTINLADLLRASALAGQLSRRGPVGGGGGRLAHGAASRVQRPAESSRAARSRAEPSVWPLIVYDNKPRLQRSLLSLAGRPARTGFQLLPSQPADGSPMAPHTLRGPLGGRSDRAIRSISAPQSRGSPAKLLRACAASRDRRAGERERERQ